MLAKRIIPCLDVKDGLVVKGVSFVNLRHAGDPVEQARVYAAAGADELTFLDITASVEARGTLIAMVERVADTLFIPFTVGGGVRDLNDFRAILRAGADKVTINTRAVEQPELISDAARSFGSQCVVVAIDARRMADGENGPRWQVFTHGARNPTAWEVLDWAREVERRGAGEILLTSIDRDGTQAGFDLELTRAVAEAVNIPIIASGGAGKLDDFARVLTEGKADAALAASLFHDRVLEVGTVKEYLKERGVPVRAQTHS